eukprot:384964_1
MSTFVAICLLLRLTMGITPTQMQQDLNNAIDNPYVYSYAVPPGNYYFEEKDFIIRNAENFTVYSSSNSVIYLNCSYKVSTINAFNVTILNISIDYDPPCFSQGVINKININTSSLTVSIDRNYPVPDKNINNIFNAPRIKVIYWNSTTRHMIVGQSPYNPMKTAKSLNNNNNEYIIYLERPMSQFYIPKIGELVTISPRVGTWEPVYQYISNCGAFMCINCSNVIVNNLIIFYAANMALIEMYGEGNNIYNNYNLIRSKKNPNNLLTANADGFHSTQNLYGPTLRNSYMEYPADDFAAVHNRINILLERISDFEGYIIDTDNGSTFNFIKPNDYIYFYELNTLNYFGFGIIDNFYLVKNETIIEEAKNSENVLESPPFNATFTVNYTEIVSVYYVKFKNKLNANITSLWSLVEFDLNNNALIENNVFYNGYDNMMRMKSNNAIIQNNTEYLTHWGIDMTDIQSYLEGELGLKNIIVRNNIMIDCNITQ